MRGWIAVDLDGTLAQYDGFKGPEFVGEPVPKMLARVKAWVAEGRDVRVFTARVSGEDLAFSEFCRSVIQDWCQFHGLPRLQVTNAKDYGMVELWDDRCVQVIPNTGERADGR